MNIQSNQTLIYEYRGIRPTIGKNVFLAPGVVILGDVIIEDHANIWFYSVIRGDVNSIRIGSQTNIQDHCVLHVTSDKFPLILGANVIVGHRAVLHGCVIEDDCLIGIGAMVLYGAKVESGAMVGAGAVVTPGSIVKANSVVMGTPAKPVRTATENERAFNKINLNKYRSYGQNFKYLTQLV